MLEGLAQFFGEFIFSLSGWLVLRLITGGRWKSTPRNQVAEALVGALVLFGIATLVAGSLFVVLYMSR